RPELLDAGAPDPAGAAAAKPGADPRLLRRPGLHARGRPGRGEGRPRGSLQFCPIGPYRECYRLELTMAEVCSKANWGGGIGARGLRVMGPGSPIRQTGVAAEFLCRSAELAGHRVHGRTRRFTPLPSSLDAFRTRTAGPPLRVGNPRFHGQAPCHSAPRAQDPKRLARPEDAQWLRPERWTASTFALAHLFENALQGW